MLEVLLVNDKNHMKVKTVLSGLPAMSRRVSYMQRSWSVVLHQVSASTPGQQVRVQLFGGLFLRCC